jgi:hypothetical protein
MQALPGHTQIATFEDLVPQHPFRKKGKGIVLLGAGLITPDLLFNNGLYQNILLFYDLFESLGYTCILLAHKAVPSKETLGPLLSRYQMADVQDFVMTSSAPLHLYVEIALSLDETSRQFFKSHGAKIVKLYLGNALNIDTETCCNLKGFYIPHHNSGAIDEIWTSPHYLQHLSYLCGINNVPVSKGRCVPYVWDRRFLDGAPRWLPCDWQRMDIVITEPNISFQKSCFYPLLLADAFARRCADWKGRVILKNADKLKGNAYFQDTVLPGLTLQKQGRLVQEGRSPLRDTLAAHPSSLFILHNWNNDYNYMLLELMDRGFPVLHNSVGWKDSGYVWSVDAWDSAQELLLHVMRTHAAKVLSDYECDAKELAWKHAPQNPVNRALWLGILEDETA